MTDLDKMARELLAAAYEADCDYRSAAAIRGRCKLGAPWAAERPAIDAIRAALLTAPPGWRLVPADLLDAFPEINPSNYDHDQACNLNAWGCQVVTAAAPEPEA